MHEPEKTKPSKNHRALHCVALPALSGQLKNPVCVVVCETDGGLDTVLQVSHGQGFSRKKVVDALNTQLA